MVYKISALKNGGSWTKTNQNGLLRVSTKTNSVDEVSVDTSSPAARQIESLQVVYRMTLSKVTKSRADV